MIKVKLKRYLQIRKQAREIEDIRSMGVSICHASHTMGTKRIFKPSEYEIDMFIDKCKKAQNAILEFINENHSYCEDIPIELIDKIKELEVSKLKDCMVLGDVCLRLGCEIKRISEINTAYFPIVTGLNLIEVSMVLVPTIILVLTFR